MEKQQATKKQLKLRGNYLTAHLLPDEKPAPRKPPSSHTVVYSSLTNFPPMHSSTRKLGNARAHKPEVQSRKVLEHDFMLLRKLIEIGEFQRAYQKAPFKSRRQKMKEQLQRAETPPSPKACRRNLRRSKSTVRRAPAQIDVNHIKRISVSDFRRSKLPGFVNFVCRRKDAPEDIKEKTRSVHCDIFGPGLCPDCQKLEHRYDFTVDQEELFPHLEVTSRSLVAAPKLKGQPVPVYVQGRWQLSTGRDGQGHGPASSFGTVVTESDIYKRLVMDSDDKKTVNVLYC